MLSNSNLYYTITMMVLGVETLLLRNGPLQMLGSSKPLYCVNTTGRILIKPRALKITIKY